MTETERFMSHVQMVPESGCWIWMGALDKRSGYGIFGTHDKTVTTHRYSYKNFVGEIPEGLCVLHDCDIRECVNPNHLRAGTAKDNAQDRKLRGRGAAGPRHGMYGRARRGSENPRAILSEEQVRHVRSCDKSHSALAREFGVTVQAIWNIRHRKTWAHI